MKQKIFSITLLLLTLIISFSCSKNEDLKKLTPVEITNFLLVNEQLPIKTLSNALEYPENVIIGLNLGLIELNEDGKEKLKDILENYYEDGKDDFIKNNNEKEWSEFVKSDWIKNETTKISKSKLNEIKKREFKNNTIIQNKLNLFIPSYIEKQTEELSQHQLNFFSKGFWKNISKITWMNVRSASGKISKRDISYLKTGYISELQIDWKNKVNLYFSQKTANTEMEKILSNFQNLNIIKYKYLSKINNKKFEINSSTTLKQHNAINNSKIDITPIVNQFNLTIIDNLGQLFIDLLFGLLILTFVNFFLRRISKDEDESKHNIIVTFFHTGTSPLKVIFGSALFLGEIISSNTKREKVQSVGSIINTIIGIILLAFSFWYISKKQHKIENEINNNFKTTFSSYFDKSSIQILDDLNLNTELFFTSI